MNVNTFRSYRILKVCFLALLVTACDGAGVKVIDDQKVPETVGSPNSLGIPDSLGGPDSLGNLNNEEFGFDYIDERSLLDPPLDNNVQDPLPIGAALPRNLQVDLSRGQTAIQSSVAFGGIAGRAVDGNRRGSVYANGSVTHTANENEPWWQVDLSMDYELNEISIWNRQDCCAERLSNFYVFVSSEDMRDMSLADLLADQSVWRHHHRPAVAANGNLIIPAPTTGRFVRVQKVGAGFLSLAEVRVYGANIAEGKSAAQSSTFGGAAASRAVDGNTNGNFNERSVSHTQAENQPWWQVDLGAQTNIGKIKLFNRRDCCGERLSHFYVFVSESDMSGRSLSSLVADPRVWKSFEVAGVGAHYLVAGQSKGRYVRVQNNTSNILHLAEVAVYGARAANASNYELNPAVYGEWSEPVDWPHIAVHAALLPSGKILSYDATPDDFTPVLDPVNSPNDTTRASIWDYATGIHTDAATDDTGDDLFCSGHTLMPDGNVFVAGGTTGYNRGIDSTNTFDYQTETWSSGPKMEFRRWYPTVTNLGNGDLLIAGGGGNVPELYSPSTNSLRTLTGVTPSATSAPWPFIMQAPNGKVLFAGGARRNSLAFIDTEGAGSLTEAGHSVVDRNRGGFAVYDAGKMMITGGHSDNTSVNMVEMNTAQVTAGSPMNLPRADHNTLVLPDGSVLVVGGNQVGGFCGDETASYAPEIWNPATGNWTLLAAQQYPRQYHSTAVLLPDGRVWSGGQGYATRVSTQVALCSYQNNAEVFSPPYLFNDDGSLATQPVISGAPTAIDYAQPFVIDTPDAADIASVSLIRLSTTTHAVNFSQRYVPVNFTVTGNNSLSARAPQNGNHAPAGFYMLFIVNNDGTPSVSKMVKVGSTERSQLTYKFDFGTGSSPLESGWMRVTPTTSDSIVSWALSTPSSVGRNSGTSLDRDLVFNSNATQLNVNTGNGRWRVTLRMGDTAGITHDNMSVTVEDQLIADNITTRGPVPAYIDSQGPNSQPTSFEVSVFDEVMNFTFADGGGRNRDWVVTSLKLELLDDVGGPAPVIDPIVNRPQFADGSVNYEVAGTGIGQIEYSWRFGDGSQQTPFSASNRSVSHQFAAPGRYNVSVTARDASGVQSSRTFTQIVYARPTSEQPSMSSGILEHDRYNQVWNVNPDNHTVTALDSNNYSLIAEVDVGLRPVSIAQTNAGDIWVVNQKSSSISVIDATTQSVTQTIALPENSQPYGLVIGSNTAYVALEAAGEIAVIDVSSGQVSERASYTFKPRHLTLSGDGNQLYASVFITPTLPFENTVSPQTNNQNGEHGGQVKVIDTTSMNEQSTIILTYSDAPISDVTGPGIPNYLGPLAISPDGSFGWLPSKQDNILNGSFRSGNTLSFDQTVRTVSSRITLGSNTDDIDARIDHDNASMATQAVFDNNGIYLFTALEGTRQVAVSDANSNSELLRFDVGRAPQSLVVSADNRRLYVHNLMDRSVSVHDIEALTAGSALTVESIAEVSTVSNEVLSDEILLGKQLFYDARDDRLAAFDYMSCASCHNDGGHDGRVWDFTQFGEGLRNTQTLKGRGNARHGNLHWTANFDEVQDFEAQIREFAGGTGLMRDADFLAGTRSEPLGDAKAGLSRDLDALAAYVNSLDQVSVYTGDLTASSIANGKQLFEQKQCGVCHSAPFFTDSGGGNDMHDIGTIGIASGRRLSRSLTGIDTPSLLGVTNAAPYLHDGSANSIAEAIAQHSNVSTTSAERNLLSQYVSSLNLTYAELQASGSAVGTPIQRTDGSVTFNDIDDGIVVEHSSEIDVGEVDFSVSFRMRVEHNPTGAWRAVAHKGNAARDRAFGLWLKPNDNRLHFAITTTQVQNLASDSRATLPVDEWVSVAYVKSDDLLQLYINGVLDTEIAIRGIVTGNDGDLYIGSSPWFPAAHASYQDFNLHHYALSAAEVAQQHNDSRDTPAATIGTALPEPASASNLLSNGGFEFNLGNWSVCSNSGVQSLSNNAFEGSTALAINSNACLFQQVPLVASGTATVSCQAASDNALYTSIAVSISDASFNDIAYRESEVTTSSYGNVSASVDIPTGAAFVAVTLYSEDFALVDACELSVLP